MPKRLEYSYLGIFYCNAMKIIFVFIVLISQLLEQGFAQQNTQLLEKFRQLSNSEERVEFIKNNLKELSPIPTYQELLSAINEKNDAKALRYWHFNRVLNEEFQFTASQIEESRSFKKKNPKKMAIFLNILRQKLVFSWDSFMARKYQTEKSIF